MKAAAGTSETTTSRLRNGKQGPVILVAGAHRLAAAKKLGWEKIEAFIFNEQPDDEARLWEIAENLHRAELSALERDEHVAEWIDLTEKLRSCSISEDVAVAVAICDSNDLRKDGRLKGPQHQESGVRAASRELGIDKNDAHRAVKVAALPEEAKEAAREFGFDDNR